jgi:hypothetical protein
MSGIETFARKVYRAPTKRRDYFTVNAAARNEASAIIEKKHPSEGHEHDSMGRCTYGGWNWRMDDHLQKVHARLERLILRQFRQQRKASK